MLVVKVELWPYGDESKAKVLATTHISNQGPHFTREGYNYLVEYSEPEPLLDVPVNKTARVICHDRNRPLDHLLAKAFIEVSHTPNGG